MRCRNFGAPRLSSAAASRSPARRGSARIETGNLTFDSATERNCACALADNRPFRVVQLRPCIFLRKSAAFCGRSVGRKGRMQNEECRNESRANEPPGGRDW